MGKEEKMDPPPPYPVANFNLKNLDSNTTQGPPKTGDHPSNIEQIQHILSESSMKSLSIILLVHGVIHVTNPPVGPKPVIVICSSCKQTVKTQVVYEPSTKTHLACLLLCVLQ